jgi:hypothetical protein
VWCGTFDTRHLPPTPLITNQPPTTALLASAPYPNSSTAPDTNFRRYSWAMALRTQAIVCALPIKSSPPGDRSSFKLFLTFHSRHFTLPLKSSAIQIPMSTGNVVFITGATGVNAAAVNGPFDRTNEKCGSYLLYNRRGDASTCVEHFQGKWQVKAVSTKGKDSCLAYIASNSDLESCISLRWSIHDGKVWSEAPAIKMTMGAEARRQVSSHSSSSPAHLLAHSLLFD